MQVSTKGFRDRVTLNNKKKKPGNVYTNIMKSVIRLYFKNIQYFLYIIFLVKLFNSS